MPSPITLQQLLRLAFGSSPVWYTPAPQALPVRWIAAGLDELQSGDLLLLEVKNAPQRDLTTAVGRGAAAVLVLGKAADFELDLPPGLPLVRADPVDDLRAVHKLLLTIFINQRAALMERGVRIHNQLAQISAEGGGLEGLAAAIGEISGRGVVIQDKRLMLLAQQPSPALVSVWADVLLPVVEAENMPLELRDRKAAGRYQGLHEMDLPGGLTRLLTPIVVGGVARGYLSLVGLGSELDSLDHLVLEQGARICAVEMARAKAVRETEKRLKGDLLGALLNEDLDPRDALLWVESIGLDPDEPHSALRFAWGGTEPPSRRRLETMVNGEVSRLELQVLVNPLGDEIVCFCPVSALDRRTEALRLGRAVIEQGLVEQPENPIRCGIGTAVGELADWRVTFRQAGQALQMARRLRATTPQHFSDLSVYRLLLQIEHSPELVAFQEELLGPLLAHESARELLNTLEAYFACNGNLTQAAESLFVHRNTLIYRMERIAAISGLDFELPETRLALQLALHIYRMRGGKF